MRKFCTSILFFACLALGCLLVQTSWAQSPKTEFRATWFTTHYGIDWPKTKATSSTNITKQKKEMTDIFDQMQAGNLNAACMQVRPVCDAFYQSSYEPWSHILTGTRGKNPGYDPLAYAVQEAHARGMELLAWVNPFRYEINAEERVTAINNGSGLAGSDPIRANHPDWLLTYDNGTFKGTILDPGNPEARAYVVKVLMEIVNNYDIDGMLMDDYFYAYGGTTTEDAASQSKYKPANQDLGDWRRENVNKVIKAVYDSIQVVKPWVRFGMAPGGIYSMTKSAAQVYGLSLPSGISGGDVWKTLYCDALAWIDGGYVDFMAPQIYWSTTVAAQDYDVLCQWWGNSISTLNSRRTDGKRVHSFVSQACYRFGPDELALEIDANRQYSPYNAPGSIFYNTNTYMKFTPEGGSTVYSCTTLATTRFAQRALPPAMSWKSHPTLAAPTNLALNGTTLSWKHASAERFSVYAYPKNIDKAAAIENSEYLVGMVYGKSVSLSGVSDLANKAIAVRAMDRYGNEFAAAVLDEEEPVTPTEPQEGTLSRVELWRKTAAETSVMSSNNRSIAYYNGKLYLADGGGKFHILNAGTGAVEQTVTISGLASNFCGHNLRVTSDGKMLLGNSGSGNATYYVYTNTLTGTTPTLAASYSESFGRSDYFYPFGDFSSNGYILMLSNANNSLMKITYSNGSVTGNQVINNTALPASTSAKAIPADSETFFASVAGVPATRHNVQTGALVDSWTGSVKPATVNVSGVAYFVLGGREFLLAPADVKGSFVTYDITGGLGKAAELLTTTTALGESANAPFTVDFAVNVQGNDAYVYLLAPNNGIAAYKYTFTPKSTGVEQTAISSQPSAISKRLTADGLVITVNGQDYTPTGIRIK